MQKRGARKKTIAKRSSYISSILFNPDGQTLVSAYGNGVIVLIGLLDTETGKSQENDRRT